MRIFVCVVNPIHEVLFGVLIQVANVLQFTDNEFLC